MLRFLGKKLTVTICAVLVIAGFVTGFASTSYAVENPDKNGERNYYNLTVLPHNSVPSEVGEILRQLVEKADYNPNRELTIFPKFFGLKAMPISVMSDEAIKTFPDRESDIISADELWHNSEIGKDHLYRDLEIFSKAEKSKNLDKDHPFFFSFKIKTVMDYVSTPQVNAFLHRSSAIGESATSLFIDEIVLFAGLRLNMSHNLVPFACHLDCDKGLIKEDEYYFASKRFLPEKLFVGHVKTFLPDLHSYIGIGYSEEMFAGISTEMLYRPYDKNYALSLEAHRLYKRDPSSKMALQLEKKPLTSAFLNLSYELPSQELLIKTSAGQYLGKDIGAEINISKVFFDNISLAGFMRYSNESDTSLAGGKTNINSGLKLSLPLGYIKKMPKALKDHSSYQIEFSPFGRRYGIRATPPVNLYKMTDHFSQYNISQSWHDIIPRPESEK